MLYLIGGTSRSGKSIVARRLLAEKEIPYLPLDSIVMGFTNGIPEYGIHDKLFPQEIAQRLWPFTKALCESLIYAGHDYAVEGEALLPVHVKTLINEHGDIKSCFIGYCETTVDQKALEIKAHIEDRNDWLARESGTDIRDHVKNMIAYSRFIREECKTYQLRYFDVSRDFTPTLTEVLRYLCDDVDVA